LVVSEGAHCLTTDFQVGHQSTAGASRRLERMSSSQLRGTCHGIGCGLLVKMFVPRNFCSDPGSACTCSSRLNTRALQTLVRQPLWPSLSQDLQKLSRPCAAHLGGCPAQHVIVLCRQPNLLISLARNGLRWCHWHRAAEWYTQVLLSPERRGDRKPRSPIVVSAYPLERHRCITRASRCENAFASAGNSPSRMRASSNSR
jgi:hypothetical protein